MLSVKTVHFGTFPKNYRVKKDIRKDCFDLYIKEGGADTAIPNFQKEFGFIFGSAVRK